MKNIDEIIFAENTLTESNNLLKARDYAMEYHTFVPSKSVCVFLKSLTKDKKEILEIESSFGVFGSYINTNNSQLTIVDPEIEKQNISKQIIVNDLNKANIRFINGEVNTVIEKIAENNYDIIFFNSYKNYYNYQKAINALNDNGLLVINNILLDGRVADSSNRDNDVIEVRNFLDKLEKQKNIEVDLLAINETILICSKK